jgi:hypothetical protein
MLQGAFATNELNLTFMYKRVLKNPRFALRTGVALKAEVEKKYPRKDYYKREPNVVSAGTTYWYFDETDTSRTKNYLDPDPYKKMQLNIGLEYRRKGNHRLGAFVGMDVFAGICTRNYSLYNVDEVIGWNGEWYVESKAGAIVLLDHQKWNSFYFGASPKMGLSYALSRHWSVSGQIAVLATVSYDDMTHRSPDAKTIVVWKGPVAFDLGINGIMDELNIVYRF